jgi:hypothetical protein
MKLGTATRAAAAEEKKLSVIFRHKKQADLLSTEKRCRADILHLS